MQILLAHYSYGPKQETIQIHTYQEILKNTKKKQNINTVNNMNESQKFYAK